MTDRTIDGYAEQSDFPADDAEVVTLCSVIYQWFTTRHSLMLIWRLSLYEYKPISYYAAIV